MKVSLRDQEKKRALKTGAGEQYGITIQLSFMVMCGRHFERRARTFD